TADLAKPTRARRDEGRTAGVRLERCAPEWLAPSRRDEGDRSALVTLFDPPPWNVQLDVDSVPNRSFGENLINLFCIVRIAIGLRQRNARAPLRPPRQDPGEGQGRFEDALLRHAAADAQNLAPLRNGWIPPTEIQPMVNDRPRQPTLGPGASEVGLADLADMRQTSPAVYRSQSHAAAQKM